MGVVEGLGEKVCEGVVKREGGKVATEKLVVEIEGMAQGKL